MSENGNFIPNKEYSKILFENFLASDIKNGKDFFNMMQKTKETTPMRIKIRDKTKSGSKEDEIKTEEWLRNHLKKYN